MKRKPDELPLLAPRFKDDQITQLARRYNFKETDTVPNEVAEFARDKKYLNLTNLKKICSWKSQRPSGFVDRNSPFTVREVTRFAFRTRDEYARIVALTTLHGVQWPTASVILHFCVNRNYPILDVRALWSLGVEEPKSLLPYSFRLWEKYINTCREIAKRSRVSIRTLDKALWQYSKDGQPRLS